VHTPDLFGGRTFASIPEGMAYVETVGFEAISDRGVRVADDLPAELVYAGFSLGVVPAQTLAQTRPGARGAVLCYSCLPVSADWAIGPWPDGVPVQIHGMDADPYFSDRVGRVERPRPPAGTEGYPDAHRAPRRVVMRIDFDAAGVRRSGA